MKRHLFLFTFCLSALLLAATGCARYEGSDGSETLQLARDFVSTQPVVLERAGELKQVQELASSGEGRGGVMFGWGRREQEEHIMRVTGSKGVILVRTTFLRKGSNPDWEVSNWGILSKAEERQFMDSVPRTQAEPPPPVTPPGVIGY